MMDCDAPSTSKNTLAGGDEIVFVAVGSRMERHL